MITPEIYLRNRFTIKPGREREFLYGKENLIRNTLTKWDLIAAGGHRHLYRDSRYPEPDVPVFQIWKFKNGDANTLYNIMYEFSEADWYRQLVSATGTQHQELLAGALGGNAPRQEWVSENDPGYAYMYEEAFPHDGMIHSYLRDLNWFTATAGTEGWRRQWSATQLTAAPSVVSVLWRVPKDESATNGTLDRLANGKLGADAARRYAAMMGKLSTLSRQFLFPIFTEWMAGKIVSPTQPPPFIPHP